MDGEDWWRTDAKGSSDSAKPKAAAQDWDEIVSPSVTGERAAVDSKILPPPPLDEPALAPLAAPGSTQSASSSPLLTTTSIAPPGRPFDNPVVRIATALLVLVAIGLAGFFLFASEDSQPGVGGSDLLLTATVPSEFVPDSTASRETLGLDSRFGVPVVYDDGLSQLAIYGRPTNQDDASDLVNDLIDGLIDDLGSDFALALDATVPVGTAGRRVTLSDDETGRIVEVVAFVTDEPRAVVVVARVGSGFEPESLDLVAVARSVRAVLATTEVGG
ncbi:MAG: hypothetical protein V3V01_02250 [Acidimicrobiales bacterium]